MNENIQKAAAAFHDASIKVFEWTQSHTKFTYSAVALLCAFLLGRCTA